MQSVLEENESALWDDRLWDISLKTDKPVDNYNEGRKTMDEEAPLPIDSLPNKDWLRAT